MGLDFRNVNTVWSSLIAETLFLSGLQTAVISPGSRSTPLTIAFTQHPHINTIPILDERSASFFALGVAKRTHLPTVLICTSGTAGANYYPAVIEARYSHVPLIILTADRPPELRNCHGGQTINQVNLYGDYPTWQTELSLPSVDLERLFYLRQNIIYAWERCRFPTVGVVHLNIPFREPLAPIKTWDLPPEKHDFLNKQLFKNFPKLNYNLNYNLPADLNIINQWQDYERGIIIAGVDSTSEPKLYCQAIANFAQYLNFPVLAEALSPVRNYADFNNYLVTTYEIILRESIYAEELIPEIVILIGEYPTSKTLRNWLNKNKNKNITYIIANNNDNLDAIHTNSIHLRTNIINLSKVIEKNKIIEENKLKKYFLNTWIKLEETIGKNINKIMVDKSDLFEAKVAWFLSQNLPKITNVFIANSMSVRYAEFFWQKNNNQLSIYFSRGANGIDGTLSTALGVAYQQKNSILLTGDLALLHDTNGFLINQYFQGSLTIILINNQGGGIFEMLPVAEYREVFEDYFATPQQVNFTDLSKTYNLEYKFINNWSELESLIKFFPDQGIRILEIKTNRQADSIWLNHNLSKLSLQ